MASDADYVRNLDPKVKKIRQSIRELARRGGISEERAFAAWFATNFYDIDEDVALEAASIDGGEDHGIDFLLTDHVNERVLILQAHLPENVLKKAPKAKFDGLVSAVAALSDPSTFEKAGRHDLAAAATEAVAVQEDYETVAGLISLGADSDQITRLAEGVNRAGNLGPWRFFYESVEELITQYESLETGDSSVPEDTIRFVDGNFFQDEGEYGRAWVGSIKASELTRLYDKHKDRLFARNVRLFLGTRKGGINEQIIQTAKSTPGKFWALNNGITIVAETIESAGANGAFTLRRFSVVNGCQTTVSLARSGAGEAAKVLARVVAANKAVVSDVVRFNNTQNAIKIWTVRASDTVQSRLQKVFKAVGIDYAPKPDNRRTKKKNEVVIQLDKVAQYIASGDATITDAVKVKSELFDRHYQQLFPNNIEAEEVLLAWMLGTAADDARQKRLQELRDQGAADKIQTALLGVAGTYWIVHCALKIVNSISPKPRRLVLEGMQTDVFKNAINKYVNEAMDIYLDLAIDSYGGDEYTSVRQAQRSPKFLQKIDQKLANKIARLKAAKGKLPVFEAVIKSIPSKAKSA